MALAMMGESVAMLTSTCMADDKRRRLPLDVVIFSIVTLSVVVEAADATAVLNKSCFVESNSANVYGNSSDTTTFFCCCWKSKRKRERADQRRMSTLVNAV